MGEQGTRRTFLAGQCVRTGNHREKGRGLAGFIGNRGRRGLPGAECRVMNLGSRGLQATLSPLLAWQVLLRPPLPLASGSLAGRWGEALGALQRAAGSGKDATALSGWLFPLCTAEWLNEEREVGVWAGGALGPGPGLCPLSLASSTCTE